MKALFPEPRNFSRHYHGLAFSLIEVVLALAVFSFSMLTLVGLLATGLNSAEGSSHNLAVANIERLLRADLDATTYANIVSTAATPSYFSASGYPTVQNPSPSSVDNYPYYTVSYTISAPAGSVVNSSSVKVIQVSILYPYPVNASTNTFSLFVAQ